MIRPTFSRKIGGAFVLLSLLTIISGTLGLTFARSVLAALRSVSESEQPVVAGFDDLDRYLRQAVALSRAVSTEDMHSGLTNLRLELERLRAESRAALSTVRRLVEDKAISDGFAAIGREQEELVRRMQDLLERQLEALSVRAALLELRVVWADVWENFFESVDALALSVSSFPPEDVHGVEDAFLLLEDVLRLQSAMAEAYARQAELLMTAMEREQQDLELKLTRAGAGLAALEAAVGRLHGFSENDWISGHVADVADRTESLHLLLFGENGLMDVTTRSVLAGQGVARIEAEIEKNAEDVIRSLDNIVRVAERVAERTGRTVILRSTPAFLTVIIVATIALSIVLTVLFSRTFTRPVSELIAATKAVAAGDLSSRAVVRSGDELEFLSKSFNRMVEQVAESAERNERINEELEDLVDSRTRDLRKQIEERVVAETALRRSELHYRTIVDNFPRGVIILQDRAGRCLFAGGEALELFGPESPDQGGAGCSGTLQALLESLQSGVGSAMRGRKQMLETQFADREWRVSMVPNASGPGTEVHTLTIILTDVTEEKESYRKLIQADKLATLGTLVAGVAHEINNPNQSVLMTGYLLRRVWGGVARMLATHPQVDNESLFGGIQHSRLQSDMPDHISTIIESSQRIEAIVGALKDYSRSSRRELTERVAVNSVVESAVLLMGSTLKKASQNVSVSLAADLPVVRGDSVRLEQVMVNLIQNACQSLKDRSGAVVISTSRIPEDNAVQMAVEDDGVGIADESLTRITDPFYTTKRDVGGTGLGLSISSAIVEEHGGDLRFISREASGTIAIVKLPAAPA